MDFRQPAKPREQILGLLVTLGIFTLFLRGIYVPKRLEQAQTESKIQNLKLEKEALEKFTQALLKQLPERQEKVVSAPLKVLKGEMAPYAQETSLLLSQLTAPPFLRGIDVKKMSDLPPEKKDGYHTSHFLITAEGPFQNVFAFLQRVERFPALMRIDNVTLKTLDTKAARVELELSGTMYHLEGKNG